MMMSSQAPPTSHYFVSQRLRLHYLDWGNASAPVLLLLHGDRDHCRNWDWTVAELRDQWHIITPDLRGHGDSEWTADGQYYMTNWIYDLAELIEQLHLAPLTLVGHSLGGNICLRYASLYPEHVRKVVAIEGLGPSPQIIAEEAQLSVAERMRKWIDGQRTIATRTPRRYSSIEAAFARMQQENQHLSTEQALHLTRHGLRHHDDGTYSWKFDNYLHRFAPLDFSRVEIEQLWSHIACPTLLIYGENSWASNPQVDGRARHFSDATVRTVANAGHWVHHDQLQAFVELLRGFL